MCKRNSRKALLLLAIASSLFLGGCGGNTAVAPNDQQTQAFADLRQSVTQSIEDVDRRARALELVDAFETVVSDYTSSLTEHRDRSLELYSNYDTTREELMELAKQSDAELVEYQRHAFELLKSLNASVTPEEQKAMKNAETKAMKAISESLSGI